MKTRNESFIKIINILQKEYIQCFIRFFGRGCFPISNDIFSPFSDFISETKENFEKPEQKEENLKNIDKLKHKKNKLDTLENREENDAFTPKPTTDCDNMKNKPTGIQIILCLMCSTI